MPFTVAYGPNYAADKGCVPIECPRCPRPCTKRDAATHRAWLQLARSDPEWFSLALASPLAIVTHYIGDTRIELLAATPFLSLFKAMWEKGGPRDQQRLWAVRTAFSPSLHFLEPLVPSWAKFWELIGMYIDALCFGTHEGWNRFHPHSPATVKINSPHCICQNQEGGTGNFNLCICICSFFTS